MFREWLRRPAGRGLDAARQPSVIAGSDRRARRSRLGGIVVKPTGAGAVSRGQATAVRRSPSVRRTPRRRLQVDANGAARTSIGSYPGAAVQEPVGDKKVTAKPPWKIGYITFGVTNQYQNNVLTQPEDGVRGRQEAGTGRGQPGHQHPAEPGAVDAGEPDLGDQADGPPGRRRDHHQPRRLRRRVARDGGRPGKQGVPVILADIPPAPGSKYQTSTWTQNQVEADAGALGI